MTRIIQEKADTVAARVYLVTELESLPPLSGFLTDLWYFS